MLRRLWRRRLPGGLSPRRRAVRELAHVQRHGQLPARRHPVLARLPVDLPGLGTLVTRRSRARSRSSARSASSAARGVGESVVPGLGLGLRAVQGPARLLEALVGRRRHVRALRALLGLRVGGSHRPERRAPAPAAGPLSRSSAAMSRSAPVSSVSRPARSRAPASGWAAAVCSSTRTRTSVGSDGRRPLGCARSRTSDTSRRVAVHRASEAARIASPPTEKCTCQPAGPARSPVEVECPYAMHSESVLS